MRVFSLFIILLFVNINLFAQDEDKVVAYGKVKVEVGNLDNTKIVLYEDGKEIETFRPGLNNGKFDFILELGHQYQFYFSKRNYVTKIVNFNTNVPDEVLNSPDFEPFPDFDFYVTLFETYPEVDTMFFKNPVGKIQYSPKDFDFDWDKNYTLEIQRRMEQIEEDIRNKREQAEKDRERKAKEAEEKAIAEAEAKEEAERQAKLEKERLAQEQKDKEKAEKEAAKKAEGQAKLEKEKAEQEAKEKELAEREAEREAEKQAKEEADRLAKENKENQKLADEQAKKEAKDREEAEKLAQKQAEEKKEAAELAQKQAEENAKGEEKLAEQVVEKAEEEPEQPREKEEVVPKTVATPPNISVPKANEPQTTKPVVTRPAAYKPKIERTDVSKQEVAGKKVTRIEVQNGDITVVYLKVEYNWGGRFFFIQDEVDEFRNISESYFNIMTSKK